GRHQAPKTRSTDRTPVWSPALLAVPPRWGGFQLVALKQRKRYGCGHLIAGSLASFFNILYSAPPLLRRQLCFKRADIDVKKTALALWPPRPVSCDSLTAEPSAGLILEIDLGELLAVVIAHDKTGVLRARAYPLWLAFLSLAAPFRAQFGLN